MKNESTFMVLLKFFGLFLLSCFVWIVVFSFLTPVEEEMMQEPFSGAVVTFGIITCLILFLMLSYNRLSRQRQFLRAQQSNIEIAEKRAVNLLNKADRVVINHQKHEQNTYSDVANVTSSNLLVGSAREFQHLIQTYPELKANISVMNLLEQIKECEYATSTYKMEYNEAVMLYNAAIHSLPTNIIAALLKITEEEFYQEPVPEITDELLGID